MEIMCGDSHFPLFHSDFFFTMSMISLVITKINVCKRIIIQTPFHVCKDGYKRMFIPALFVVAKALEVTIYPL